MRLLKTGMLLLTMLWVAGCSADDLSDYRKEIGPGITDYGDRNAENFKGKLQQLAKGGQIGRAHV